MNTSYYYLVETKIVLDHEESSKIETFKQPDIKLCRAYAFDFFDDQIKKYRIQFSSKYSPLEPCLKIHFVTCTKENDFDDNLKIDVLREERHELYSLSEGKLQKYENNFNYEIKVLTEIGILNNSFSISELYDHSAENSFISSLETILSTNNSGYSSRKNDYGAINCYKCNKKVEISKDLISANTNDYKRVEPKFACNSCISSFYSTALDMISYGVYDVSGNPVNKRTPKI